MGGKKRTLRGYMYYLGIHFVICHGPVDKFIKLYFEDRLAWEGDIMDTIQYVNQPGLYGGYRHGGGVYGNMSVNSGKSDQTQDTYLKAQLGDDVPAFRGVFSIVFRQMQLGFSPYLKRPAFMVQRIHKTSADETQWYDAKAAIGTDMNPSHIIRECLTDRAWGMGYDSANMGDSFTTVADTLYTEGMGMSMIWNTSTRLKNFIDEIKKHINATLYIDRSTGLFEIKLIRDDYVIEDLPEFDQSNITKIMNFRRMTVADLTSEVVIVYTDQDTDNDATVTARNLALVNQQGVAVGTRLEFKGFTSRAIATLVANRELKTLSYPLAACDLHVNQAASELNIGDPIKVVYPNYGIESLIMRVMSIDFGDITDNIIKLNCVEDVFGTDDIAYTVPPGSIWAPIMGDPTAVTNRIYNEIPYWDLIQVLGETLVGLLGTDAGYFGVTGEQPQASNVNASLYVDSGGGYEESTDSDLVDFCQVCTITADITELATSLVISTISNTTLITVGTYAVIGDEIIIIDSVASNLLGVTRGAGDTVPAEHDADDTIFFVQDFYGSDDIEYADSESVSFKLLSRTNTEELDIGDATADTLTFDSRQIRPYPPGQFKINGTYYPTTIVEGDIVVTWVARNRITQSSALIGFLDGAITAEAGTTYTCQIKNGDTDAIISTQTGITLSTCTFLEATVGTPDKVKVELWAVRDGYASFQIHENLSDYILDSSGAP